jgi:predicted metal-dependent phosphotriesterase family hydrolase
MKTKVESMEKMNVYANEMVRLLVKDEAELQQDQLRKALENVLRTIVDMTNIQLGREKDAQATLQTTLTRMRIAHNCLFPYASSRVQSKIHLAKALEVQKISIPTK